MLEANPPPDTPEKPLHLDTPLFMWSSVNTSLPMRTALSPSPRDLDILGLLIGEDLDLRNVPPTTLCLHACIKSLRKATRLFIWHARNLRRLKYGKALLHMFVKKPSVALKSILQTAAG
jgi:hypothetical protein